MTATRPTATIRQAVRNPSMSISISSNAGAAAKAKLPAACEIDDTNPRRRSNHCATIVRDDSVSSPCPLNRRQPKPMLITTRPTGVLIAPTKLRPVTVAASPIDAAKATTRDPYRSIALPPYPSSNPLDPVPMRYAIANCRRVRPVAPVRSSVKTLTPAVWPGTEATMPIVPATRTTQP